MLFRHRTFALRALPLLLALLGAHASAAPSTQSGWTLLWDNRFAAAERAFQQEVAANPRDASAWRGLGWVNYIRDDEHATLVDWGRAVLLAPTDWTTPGLWSEMTAVALSNRDLAAYEAAAQVLASTPGVRPDIASSARLVLSHRADRDQSFAAGDRLRKPLCIISDWRVIGPFDNVSKSGYDKPFAPEQSIDLTASYAGKDDKPLVWRRCPVIDHDNNVYVGAFLGDNSADVFYAVTAVDMPSDTDAIVRYDSDGASKVYIDGRLAHAQTTYRGALDDVPDGMSFPAHFVKGWNVILVKTADDVDGTSDLDMRITDAAGTPVKLLGIDSSRAAGAANTPQKSDDDGGEAVGGDDWLTSALAGHEDEIEGSMLLGMHDAGSRDFEAGEARLRSAIAAHPNCAVLHWKLSELLDLDDQPDDARAERTTLRAITHDVAEVELTAATSDLPTATQSDKIRSLRELARRFPQSDDIDDSLVDALKDASFSDEAYRIARKNCRRYGDAPEEVANLAGKFEDDDSHSAELIRLLSTAVKRDPADYHAVNEYAGLLYRDSQYAASLTQYRRALDIRPQFSNELTNIADAYDALGNRTEALKARRQYAALRPLDASAYSDLGDALVNMGKKKDAIVEYNAAIALDPTLVDLRDKVQLLTGQKPVMDLVSPLPTPNLNKLRGKSASDEPSVTYIVDDGREVVYPDYATQCWFHQVIKLNDQSAEDEYQSFSLAVESGAAKVTVISARLIKADGKVEDHTSDDGGSSDEIDFPSLAPGDIIDVTYTVQDHATGALSHSFWANWYFAHPNQLVRASRFALITPANMDYTYVAHGGASAPTEKVSGNWRIRQWSTSDPAPLPDEQDAVPSRDWAPWVDISNVKSWSQIVSWYEDLSSPRCVADAAIRAKAAELTQGATTDDEKIARLVRYVSHDIQYQSTPFRLSAYVPTEGKQVIRERYGDCKDKAALLTALLSTIGIHSRMVLLTPREFGTTPYLPSPRFAHAIALVDTPEGQKYIDGTADGLEYVNMPWGDQGVPALVIDPSTDSLQTTPVLPASSDTVLISYAGSLNADGSSKGSLKFVFNGNYGWLLRSVMNRVSAEKQQLMVRRFATSFATGDFDTGGLDGLQASDLPVTMNVQSTNSHLGSPAGSFLLVDLPWSVLAESTNTDMEGLDTGHRRSAVRITIGGETRYHVELKLPDGYAPQELPAAVSDKSQWGSYSIAYAYSGGTLTADFTDDGTVTTVDSGDVATYVAFVKKKIASMSGKLVLKKTS